MRNLVDLAENRRQTDVPGLQSLIQADVDAATDASELAEAGADAAAEVGLANKKDMHLMNAAMFETIRLTCSPIVPHQATRDSTVGGYRVEKGTVVFINNHILSMSPELWQKPEQYNPFRFLSASDQFKKPEHFQPFSTGRRSCMGYKIVQIVSFFVISNLLKHFTIDNPTTEELSEAGLSPNPEIALGMLALPPRNYTMKLTARRPTTVVGA